MTTVTITTTTGLTSEVTSPARMILRTIDNKLIMNFPIAPREMTYDGFGWTWSEVPRDGRYPYLVREAYQLPTIEFTANLVYSMSPDASVEPLMTRLKDMKTTVTPLTMKYGGWFDTRLWRISELSFDVKQRDSITNSPTWAEASVTLTNVSDIKLTVGPVSGGKKTTTKTPSKSTNKTKNDAKKSTKTRYYKVKSGDTLLKLANKLYGDPQKWRYLADKNKIKNPKNSKKLKRGSKIKY